MKKKKSDSEGFLFESSYIEIFGEKEAVLTGKNEIIELKNNNIVSLNFNKNSINYNILN